MIYRGESVKTPCYLHDANEARGTCSGCLKPICDICATFVSQDMECPPCARSHRRRRGVFRALGGAFLVAIVGGFATLAGYVVTRPAPFDYGADGNTVKRIEGQLVEAPCDNGAIIELLETMERARNHKGVLTRAAEFEKKCGEYYRVHWVTYAADEAIGDHLAAAAEATRLIDHRPDDKDYWWWRGKAWEGAGQLEKAAADYQQSLTVMPELRDIPQMLARVYERLGQPCKAYKVLAQLNEYHPDDPAAPSVAQRMQAINERHNCVTEQITF